jgi:CheY-like chemotaxis protein
VPIIALTADVSPEQTSACREAGMNAHVAKPLDVPELLATIRSAVSPRDAAAEEDARG